MEVVTNGSKVVTNKAEVVTDGAKAATNEAERVTNGSKVTTSEPEVVTDEVKVTTDGLFWPPNEEIWQEWGILGVRYLTRCLFIKV